MGLFDNIFRPSKKVVPVSPNAVTTNTTVSYGGSLNISDIIKSGSVTKVTHPDEAQKMSRFYSNIHKISSTVATLSRNWYRRDTTSVKLSDTDYTQVAIWKHMMFPGLVPSKVIKTWIVNYLKGGNGYLIIKRDNLGNATAYINRKWNEMYPFYDMDDNIWYYDYKTKRAFFWMDILHLADITDDALVGKTKVSHQAETLGISKAARTFVNKYYDKGLFLGAVVEYPESIQLDDETARSIEGTMNSVYGGVEKLTGVGVIDSGGKLHQLKMDMPLKDAAYIEQEVRTDQAIDSFFSVPSEIKTQDDINQYYNDAIMPIIRMIEEEVGLKVPIPADVGKYYLKFEVDSILRAAPETKINVITKSIDKGLMTINEGREKMELPPIAGGDQTLVMANNLVPLAELEDFVKSKM